MLSLLQLFFLFPVSLVQAVPSFDVRFAPAILSFSYLVCAICSFFDVKFALYLVYDVKLFYIFAVNFAQAVPYFDVSLLQLFFLFPV